MRQARYHPAARSELRGAVAYAEADRPGRGSSLVESVQRSLRRVRRFPQSGTRWSSSDVQEIRRTQVRHHPYVIVYLVVPDAIVVLAVAHTSKRPDYWRDRAR